MKLKGVIVFSFILLVTALGNPYAFNPIASTPIIMTAYAESTDLVGSERGSDYRIDYYGNDAFTYQAKHILGLPELIENPQGNLVTSYMTQDSDSWNIHARTNFEIEKSNCDLNYLDSQGSPIVSTQYIPQYSEDGNTYYNIPARIIPAVLSTVDIPSNGTSIGDVLIPAYVESSTCNVVRTSNGIDDTYTITKTIGDVILKVPITIYQDSQVEVETFPEIHNTVSTQYLKVREKLTSLSANVVETSLDDEVYSKTNNGQVKKENKDGETVQTEFTQVGNTIENPLIILKGNDGKELKIDSNKAKSHLQEVKVKHANDKHGNPTLIIQQDFTDGIIKSSNQKMKYDPTFTDITASSGRIVTTASTNDCDSDLQAWSSDSAGTVVIQKPTTASDNCQAPYFSFSLASFPTGQVITDATIEYDVTAIQGTIGNGEWLQINEGTVPSGDINTYDDIVVSGKQGTLLVSSDTGFSSIANGVTTPSFSSGGLTALQTVADAQGTFHVGAFYETATRDGTQDKTTFRNNDAVLQVTYVTPIVPLAPTNDGVTSGINLDYDWTFNTNYDNATQPAITDSLVYVGDTKELFQPLHNSNATAEADVGAVPTTSSSTLMHMDTLQGGADLSGLPMTNLLAYYDMESASGNEENDCSLLSGATNCATSSALDTIGGDTREQTGKIGNSIELSGSGSYMDFESNILSGLTDATICGWYDLDITVPSTYATLSSYTSANQELFISGGTGVIGSWDGGASASGLTMAGGTWEFMCYAMVSGNHMDYYLDGTFEHNNTWVATWGGTLTLGSNTAHSENFNGHMDEITIWNIALTESEMDILYASGAGLDMTDPPNTIYDNSGDDNHGVVTNPISYTGTSETFDLDLGDWVTQDATYSSVNTGSGVLDMYATSVSSIQEGIHFDLGSEVCDTTCVLQGTWTVTAQTHNGVGYEQGFYFGLSDQDSSVAESSNQDFIGMALWHDNIDRRPHNTWADGESLLNNRVYTTAGTAIANLDDGCFEIVRTSTTGMDTNWYSDTTCTTLVNSDSHTIDATITGLDHIIFTNLRQSDGFSGSETSEWDNIKLWDGTTSTSGTPDAVFPSQGSTTLNTSSIDSDLSNEIQFNNAGLNVTSSQSTIEGTSAWTLQGLVTLNTTATFPLLSFDSGSEVLLNLSPTHIGLSKGGTDIMNHTLTTSLDTGNPQAISISRDASGNYETLINGTESVTSLDNTSLGTVTDDLYHIGFDTSLGSSSTWRLDELFISIIEETEQNRIDFGNRIIPFVYQATVSAPTTTYQHTGLASETDKCFYVLAVNSVGNSDRSGVECGTTANPVPSTPTNLLASPVSGSIISIDWDDAPSYDNITGFRIFQESPTGNGFIKLVNDTGTSTSIYSDTGLTFNTQYNYMVAGINATGIGSNSTASSAYTNDAASQPTNLIATASSDSVIGLDWDDALSVDNITGYRIFQESPTGNGFIKLVNDTASATSSYSDTLLTTLTQYNYMVAGINATGVGSNSTASADYTWGVPDPITLFTIITPTVDTLTGNFTAAISNGYPVTDYEVLKDNVFEQYTSNATTFISSALSAVTSYEYSVRAISSFGNSTWVNATGTTVTSPPTSLVVTDCYHTCTTQLNLDWVAPVPSTGVNGYKIETESPIGGGWSTLVANTTTTTLFYNHTGLVNDGVFHNYRIYALTPDGDSAVSNTYSYTTHKLPDSIDDLAMTTNAILQFLLSWSVPDNLNGSLEYYQINYTTPAGDPLTIHTSTQSGTSAALSGFDPSVEHSFRVSAITNHGTNATFSNIQNGTLTSEIAVGDLDFALATNPDAPEITYVLYNVDSTTDDVQVRFDAALNLECTIDQRISGINGTYTSLSETVDGSVVYHNFTVTNGGYDILDFDCYDQTDLTINSQYSLTQSEAASGVGGFGNVPLFSQIGNFSDGAFGTDGDFAGIDLMTMFIVIVAMLGFNRTNPALGVGVMAAMLGAAWYFELIPWTSGLLGGVAVVLVLAIGMGLKKRD